MKTLLFILDRRARAIFALCALVIFAVSPTVVADDVTVGASVPYDPPTQQATFDPQTDDMTVHDALYTVGGTCQLMNPQTVVSIWRDGVSIGSAACTGSYQLQIMLKPGVNNLIARTANVSTLYGPDSVAVTVTLVLPDPLPSPDPVSSGSTDQEPSTPEQITVATNAAAASGLDITTSQPFSVLSSSNSVTITVLVDGGEHPYDIIINWGDGSVDTHHVDAAGSYTYDHQYQAPGTYKVHGRVHDVLGAYSEFDYSVISSQKFSSGSSDTTGQKITNNKTTWWHYAKPTSMTVGGAVIIGGTYWMGLRRATSVMARRYEAEHAARALRARSKAKASRSASKIIKPTKNVGRKS